MRTTKFYENYDIPQDLVKVLSGFFFKWGNCRGYDPNTPLGEIAKHAHIHWQNQELTIKQLQDDLDFSKSHERVLNSIINSLEVKLKDTQERCYREKHIQKYKRCLLLSENHLNLARMSRDAIRLISSTECLSKEVSENTIDYFHRREERQLKFHYKWLDIANTFKE